MAVSIKTYERDIWEINTQVALIRFSLRHLSQIPQFRRDFLDERTKQIRADWDSLAKTQPEEFLGMADLLVPTFAQKECEWLRGNLHAVIEFSEHRLNQMELVVRYAFFESVLTDVIGNILWEYPLLIDNTVHKGVMKPKTLQSTESPEDFRARRTKKLVEEVNKLPYKPTPNTLAEKRVKPDRPACLCEYLEKGIDLVFQQKRFADIIERVHKVRNNIAHRVQSSPQTLTDEFMTYARFALSEFPRQLIRAAVDVYPDACTTEGESERPGYMIREILKNL